MFLINTIVNELSISPPGLIMPFCLVNLVCNDPSETGIVIFYAP